ncbi:MAG: hypothetical protein ABI867_37850 [Kofleriaceae bacterium]
MRLTALAVLALGGCSFVGVRSPKPQTDPPTYPVKCNDSGILPALDALGGAAAISVMGGGIILERTDEDHDPQHFTLYYAGPLLALAVVYWASASFGNTRTSRCSDMKEAASRTQEVVRPIEPSEKPKPKPPEIEIQ